VGQCSSRIRNPAMAGAAVAGHGSADGADLAAMSSVVGMSGQGGRRHCKPCWTQPNKCDIVAQA
jgi:hypothetical protein